MAQTKTVTTRDPILVDLALQGGGSHGAFTWGVLDRLLEEPWLGIDGISGTSAGAMNAAVLVDGHAKGGAAGRSDGSGEFLAPRLRRRLASALSGAGRSMCFLAAGRWILRRSMSQWTSCLACYRPMT